MEHIMMEKFPEPNNDQILKIKTLSKNNNHIPILGRPKNKMVLNNKAEEIK